MAAKNGNQSAKDKSPFSGAKPGKGGRPSAFHEKADAEQLWNAFVEPRSQAELEAKIKSGTYSLLDRLIFMAHGGNERILCQLLGKLYPDRVLADTEIPTKLYRMDGYRDSEGKWVELPSPTNGASH